MMKITKKHELYIIIIVIDCGLNHFLLLLITTYTYINPLQIINGESNF